MQQPTVAMRWHCMPCNMLSLWRITLSYLWWQRVSVPRRMWLHFGEEYHF